MRTFPSVKRTHPIVNSDRAFPVQLPAEAFVLFPGHSKRVLLTETVAVFHELGIEADTISLIEYLSPSGSWTTITVGSPPQHSDVIEATRFITDTPSDFGTREWKIRVTADGKTLTRSIDLLTELKVETQFIRCRAGQTVRPFATARFAESDTNISNVMYQVSGAVTVSKTAVPRLEIMTGTHDGSGNSVTLDDSTADFIGAGVSTGDTMRNVTDGSEAEITGVGAESLSGALAAGTDDDWDASDAYIIFGSDTLATRVERFEYTPAIASPPTTGTHILTLYVSSDASPVTEVSADTYIEVIA